MLRTLLRPYQEEAVEKALQYDGFCLFPEQRTGKCLISLAIVNARKPDVLIIVCPEKAMAVWWSQIEQHLDLDWRCKITVINFEGCSRTKKQRAKFRREARERAAADTGTMVICDEAQRIKRRGSFQARLVRYLGHLATWRLALTGTPIAQGAQDAWAIFDFIQRGVFFNEWEDFEDRYLVYGGYQSRKVVGYRHRKEFDRIFHQYSFRVTFNEARKSVGLKAARIKSRRIFFELDAVTRNHYTELERDLETVVQDTKVKTPLVLTLAMKLQQLAGGYLINTTQVPGEKKVRTVLRVGREKLYNLQLLITKELTNRKFVICVRFRHEMEAIAKLLDRMKLTHKTIAGGHKFDGEFDVHAIILQIQSGVAFDLSAANVYVFYSWNHSYIDYEQSRFRILSFATEQVDYYFLIAKGTVDEDLFETITRKKNFATMLIDKYRRGYREHHKTTRRDTGRARKAHP